MAETLKFEFKKQEVLSDDDNNNDNDGHLGAGEVSVCEVVEDCVHGVMLATPRGNLAIIIIIVIIIIIITIVITIPDHGPPLRV